jgi:hypothetical protein
MSGESTIADSANGSRYDASLQGARFDRVVWRRESALLIALVVLCEILKSWLALVIKFADRSEAGRTRPILAVVIALTCLVPFALRISPRLGLPGAPLIVAKIAGEKLRFSIRSLLKISASYALLALAAGATVLLLVIVPIAMAHPGVGHMKSPLSSMMNLAPGRIAIIGTLVAVAAAISEEIEFRLVLFAVVAWVVRLITRSPFGKTSRGVLWIATILQAYVFGMLHLIRLYHTIPIAASMLHSIPAILVGGLVLRQTWEGIVLGRLYLKRGLEASMLAHAMIDAALFVLVAIGLLLRAHPAST